MSENISLKELYKDYFRIGVACEKTGVFHDDRELGNPEKELLILRHFNSITFENELKPEYNMGFNSPDATETYLPFVICPAADYGLKWAKANNIPVRGHVLIWHTQCSDEIFCKEYKPVYLYGEQKRSTGTLDPICYASRDTMLKRMQSYIYSAMEYMYTNGYGKLVYAWDVANETTEPEFGLDNGMRKTYWYNTIGPDYVYWAFRYTRESVDELAQKYMHLYDINDINEIKPKLFLCEYNEWEDARKKAVIGIINASTESHGSILEEGLIDGIGLQGHTNDDSMTSIPRFINTVKDYASVINNIHITEFDVKALSSNKNREYIQGVYCQKLFEGLVELKNSGINISSVTVWGLTDDKACFSNSNPLLFRRDLTAKPSFYGIANAVTGDSLLSPYTIERSVKSHVIDFEYDENDGIPEPSDFGCYSFGFGDFAVSDKVVHSGKYALSYENRYGLWGGILVDISKYRRSVITVEAWVKCKAPIMMSIFEYLDGSENQDKLAAYFSSDSDDWVYCKQTFNLLDIMSNYSLLFMSMDRDFHKDCPVGEHLMSNSIYIDDIKITVDGIHYDFDHDYDIIKIRDNSYLPIYFQTVSQSMYPNERSLCIIRSDHRATVCLHLDTALVKNSTVTMHIKTKDNVVRIGLDGSNPIQLIESTVDIDSWNEIQFDIGTDLNGDYTDIYIETDGYNDIFINDVRIIRR